MPSIRFPRVNERAAAISTRLEKLLRRPPAVLRLVHAPLRPLLRAVGISPWELAARVNWRRGGSPHLRAPFREELERYFAAEVSQLEQLLGRALWFSSARRP